MKCQCDGSGVIRHYRQPPEPCVCMDEHCADCDDTGGPVIDENGKYRTCHCTDDLFFCPECGREVDRERYFCDEYAGGCGWIHDEYEPTSAELDSFYNGARHAIKVNEKAPASR